jgi:hypothetical protein
MVGTIGKPNAWNLNQEINVLANKGTVHVRFHVECEQHKTAVGAETSPSKLTRFFLHQEENQILTAECAFAFHSVKQRNYKSSGCTSVLFRKFLLILKKPKVFKCARTKTGAIINPVIEPNENKMRVFINITVCCCTVATDVGSQNAMKVFPFVIHYFVWKNGGLPSKLTEV